jgi:hypothetical protein
VVAFIDDDEPVLREDLRGVVGPGERLQRCEVYPAGEFRLLAAAELADLPRAEA